MNLNFTEASALATIDLQLNGIDENIPPAQYEIIRQVIYQTADLEYQSLLKFSPGALAKGAAALMAVTPIIVDVPEVQVSIVPNLQKTFGNLVYCCATISSTPTEQSSKAAGGLELLGHKYPQGIFIIGQDQAAMSTMFNLLQNQVIEPSLAIATPPIFTESETKQRLNNSDIPHIYINNQKGGANIASAIINSLIRLTWRAERKNY